MEKIYAHHGRRVALCYHQGPFVDGLSPYAHQMKTLDLYGKQYTSNKTMCIENASVTGSGKTLANFAAAILDDTRTIGIYPTNELLLDQYVSIQKHLCQGDIGPGQ